MIRQFSCVPCFVDSTYDCKSQHVVLLPEPASVDTDIIEPMAGNQKRDDAYWYAYL